METLREKYNISPKAQRDFAKYLCEELKECMVSMGGEDKVNSNLERFFSLYFNDHQNYTINYNISFNQDQLKIWMDKFNRTKKEKKK